jgi:hypothetical protein
MNSRLFEESLIVRFLKQLLIYARNSYLFHFDFKLAIYQQEEAQVKPLGFFESLLTLLSRGLGRLTKAIASFLEGSFLFRTKVAILKSLQEDSVSSVIYFMLGFLALYGLKSMSTTIIGLSVCLGLFTLWGYPMIQRYASGSLIFKMVTTFLKGGDPK